MPKFKSTQDIIRIIGNKDQIRNFGVIAHVDHGKTTMSDSLLAASGIISPSVAGQALALDSMKLEQNRQMTIRGANVTLFYEQEGKEYLINMIDTPGHIDFTGRVTRALRAIDGVVVVSDSVEGIMTQTETVTRQALEERVRPVLYINKIDRLVKELRLDPPAMQKWLSNIIAEFNKLIDIYAEPEIKEKWKVSIQGNTVAFGSAKDRWGFNYNTVQKKGISFKDVYDAYTSDNPNLIKELAEKAPLHDAVLGMVVQHHPPPHVAQRYRIPKIWPGDLDSDTGKALLACDEKGPIIMMVTTINVDQQAGRVATGRLFSGTVKDGDEVYLLDAKRTGKVQSVNIYMGNTRELVNIIPAGNIPALLGLDYAVAGETLSSVKTIPAFESIKYVSEPVVTIAVEPKHPKDLPKLVEALRRITVEDPNLIIKINEESGETLMAGMGVLHLEIATSLLQEAGLDITTTQPLINYRETIRASAGPTQAQALRDKWCKDVHIRFFVGGAEGDAFGTIVYNGAKQAARPIPARRSTTSSPAGTSEKMVQQLREAVAAQARRHRHDGPSRRRRDHAARRGGVQGRHQDDVPERAGAEGARQVRRRLCRRPAGSRRATRSASRRCALSGCKTGDTAIMLGPFDNENRGARELGTVAALKEAGAQRRADHLAAATDVGGRSQPRHPGHHRGPGRESRHQVDRLSRRPACSATRRPT